MTEPSFTVGMEEEYLLVDLESRDLVSEPPDEMMAECERRLGTRVSHEFLQAQIEIGTRKCDTIGEAAVEIIELRRTVAEVAGEFGMAPIAASTHPFASWNAQQYTQMERYHILARDMQAVARRLLTCGMHVHVGLDDDDLRIDLMGQITYFLPHLLALSTSSPFWRGENTGLMSYRLAAFDEMPRTGLPEKFDSWGEYQRHLNILIKVGAIDDATKIWWDLRPSARYPTLEMRISDVCTTAADGVSVAAIYLCILHTLYRLKRNNQRWRRYSRMLVRENRWRAQRYGIDEGLVDFGRGEIVPYADLLEEIIELVYESAVELGCVDEVNHARTIVERGTSAHHQLRIYGEAMAEGVDKQHALMKVVDHLIDQTLGETD